MCEGVIHELQAFSVKARQFHRLAGLPKRQCQQLVLEGLHSLGENIATIAKELEVCNEARSSRAARLLHNVGKEEAGKFLLLIDAWRSPSSDQARIARQFRRAGDHLSKLIYAQVADYSIGSQGELLGAVDRHRQALHLDGPNDYDWIFRNALLMERETALYVDLVETEGGLSWWAPCDIALPMSVPDSVRLVQELLTTGLVSLEGLDALSSAWTEFDAHTDSHCSEWRARTEEALLQFPDNVVDGHWRPSARFVADRWPMPMVEVEIERVIVEVEALIEERKRRHDKEMRRQYGD